MPRFGENLSKKIHDQLMPLLQGSEKQIITRDELRKYYIKKYPHENVGWVQATDHCVNRTNKGACWCAKTNSALFEWQKRGRYKVL